MSRWDDDGGTNFRMWSFDLRGILIGCGCLLLLAILLMFVVSWALIRILPTLAIVALIAGVILLFVMRPRR